MVDTEKAAPLIRAGDRRRELHSLGGIKIARWIPDRGTLAFHDKATDE